MEWVHTCCMFEPSIEEWNKDQVKELTVLGDGGGGGMQALDSLRLSVLIDT